MDNRGDGPRDSEKDKTPFRVHLPGFIQEEVGLGDVIKRVTYAMGITPCAGCEQRATTLNQWMTFSPGTKGKQK